MSPLFWPLLIGIAIGGLLVLVLIWALDLHHNRRRDARNRARRPAPIVIAPQPGRLPRAVAIPRAWRDGKWSS